MSYPPTYTNLWDITTPPDTQAANQLGADIRNLKTDIMQRMALMSGTYANIPSPDTVNATWGGTGFGILYFATDTKRVYQWNGAAWVDVTYSIGGGTSATIDNSKNDLTNPATFTNLNQVIIPAGVVVAGTVIELAAGVYFNTTGNITIQLTDNSGTSIAGATFTYTGDSYLEITSRIFAVSTGVARHVTKLSSFAASGNGVVVRTGTASIDLVNANTLTVQAESSAASVSGYGMFAKVFG